MTTLDTLNNLWSDDKQEAACAAQALINSGMAWRLEGSVGRHCMGLIEAGACMCGTSGVRDYYGNYVPSRTEVQEGTKGSRGFVVERQGEEWAAALDAVEG